MSNMIQKATQKTVAQTGTSKSISSMINSMLDGEGMRKRFNELLGKRAPQFISSVISLVNADSALQQAMYEAPGTVIQSALKAAMYDLPIDPALGYAYIVAFKNKKKDQDGREFYLTEATFIMGYKGMEQLAIRSGVYSRIPDAVDVREGELKRYDRLTGDAEFSWIEDEDEREKLPIIGYAGYFRLLNGAEKTIYMTQKQIENHEKKNRKGKYMGKGWREDWDTMARKTVLRRLISKYGLMSIDYRMDADRRDIAMAQANAFEEFSGDGVPGTPESGYILDNDTGELLDEERSSEKLGQEESNAET